MNELAPVDAALFAFRKRDARFVMTRAAVAYVALALVTGAAALVLSWPAVMGLADWYLDALRAIANGEEPTTPPLAPLWSLLPWSLALGVVGWVLMAAFEAACLRWLVRGERGGGFLGLTLGADTWRVFATYWAWLAMALSCVLVVCAFYLGLRSIAGLGGAAQIGVMIIAVLAPLAAFAMIIVGAVRLAPAAAMTIARGKFSFFSAWPATRGAFWPLLGAFIVAAVGWAVVSTLLSEMVRLVASPALTPIMREMLTGANATVLIDRLKAAFMTPPFIAMFVVYAIVQKAAALMFNIAFFGINARAIQASQSAVPAAATAAST